MSCVVRMLLAKWTKREGCERGLILCNYSFKEGVWLDLSCASVLRVFLSSVWSDSCMVGDRVLSSLLGFLFDR